MFKLVVVGGRLRGKEFVLNEGENIIGRGADCDVSIPVEGVSKKHLRVTVNAETIFAEDLGSSNGTLVNGKMIKKITMKDGDKIVLPNLIFQVVYVLEKKIVIKKKVFKGDDPDDDVYDDLEQTPPMPQSLLAKPIWLFKYKIMPIAYSFNETYEWAALVGILLFAFVGINTSLTILPVLSDSKKFLIKEIALRGKQYAAEVDRFNNIHLREKNLDRVYTGFLDGDEADGVKSYRLFDLEGRVYRPISELNTIVSDRFSVDARNYYMIEKNQDSDFIRDLGNNTIGIARAIKASDRNLGRDVVVAIIAIEFSPSTLVREASYNYEAYLETLMTSAMVAIIFFGIFYYLTVRPMEEMRIQIERVLRGRMKELQSKSLFKELSPLRNSINSVLFRIREMQNAESGEIMELEDEGPYIQILQEFMAGAQGPVMILNSEKIIQNINPEAEDLLGLRETSSSGVSIGETTLDRGLAANLIELCDNSANNEGRNEKTNYEVKGRETEINVTSLIGRDKFAKGFYVTFVQEK